MRDTSSKLGPMLLAAASLAFGACMLGEDRSHQKLEGPQDAAGLQAPRFDGSWAAPAGQDAGRVLPPETCNGWDDDGDGQIDEDTGGERCDSADGPGTQVCVRGALKCLRCAPGETQTSDCPCGAKRVDRCNETGRWVLGTCDGCPATYQPAGCDAPDACRPGDQEYRACDFCGADGGTCGSKCVGARWSCTDQCQWVQATPCEVVNVAECTADQTLTETCGACGTRKLLCDGCFWVRQPCKDQGACKPGTKRTVPCYGAQCAEGFTSEISCQDTCTWSAPAACSGCVPGTYTDKSEECLANHPACGVKVTRTECLGSPVGTCGGSTQLVHGEVKERVVKDECPAVECTPGQTEDLGACPCPTYRKTRTCGQDCRWKVSECPVPVCAKGETRKVSCYEGDGLRTDTCGDCGWTPGAACVGSVSGLVCECHSGATLSQSCGPSGSCMSRQLTCVDCRWTGQGGACTLPAPCTAANNKTTQVSCGANACGKTYSVTTTCDLAVSCTLKTTSDQSTACPPCQKGQTRTKSCTTASGACGAQTEVCDDTCTSFVPSGTCQASATACTPGETQVRDCTTAVDYCGAPGTEKLRCNGCGWDVIESCKPKDASVCQKGTSTTMGTCACGSPDTRTCTSTCKWGPSSCSSPCSTGDVTTQACTWSCNLPGKRQVQCNGCGWVEKTPCMPDDSSRCVPGTQTVLSCPDQPGGKAVTCGSNCTWPGC